MSLKPSKLRRLNQRITLAMHKIKSSVPGPLLSLVAVLIAENAITKYAEGIMNKPKILLIFEPSFSNSEIRLLRKLAYGGLLLGSAEAVLEVVVAIRVLNALIQSYSNSKY